MLHSAHVIFTWDLDKTYLRSEFGSWRALVRAAFEKAEAKRSVPGAPALLREVARLEGARVHFVSGSPRQMRRVIERKLRLDGVRCDRLVLKPNLSNVLRGRFRAVREQIGFKLPALLMARAAAGAEAEFLFGDDAESDAYIYSLYADAIAGRVEKETLAHVGEAARLYPEDLERLLAAFSAAPRADAVRRVFIHLETYSPPGRYDRYGRRLVPVYNFFQAAVVLFEDGAIDADAVVRVGADMLAAGGYEFPALVNSLQDLYRRGFVRVEAARALGEAALRAGDHLAGLASPAAVVAAFDARLREVLRAPAPWPEAPFAPDIAYVPSLGRERPEPPGL